METRDGLHAASVLLAFLGHNVTLKDPGHDACLLYANQASQHQRDQCKNRTLAARIFGRHVPFCQGHDRRAAPL
jgi:hypothetical protein